MWLMPVGPNSLLFYSVWNTKNLKIITFFILSNWSKIILIFCLWQNATFQFCSRRDVFPIMPRKFTAVIKYWFKVIATSLSSVPVFPSSTKEIFVVLTPLSERKGLTVFQKVYYQLFYLNQDYYSTSFFLFCIVYCRNFFAIWRALSFHFI